MITKVSGHSNTVNGLELTWADQYLFSSAFSQRIINMWSLKESDSYELIQTFSTSSPPNFILSHSENRSTKKRKTKRKKSQSGEIREVDVPVSSLLLSICDKKLSIWQFSLTMQQNKPLSPNTTIVMPKQDQDVAGIDIFSACFLDSNSILLVRGTLIQPRFEKVVSKLIFRLHNFPPIINT